MGRDAVIFCAISKSKTSVNVKQWLVEPLFFEWAFYRGGPEPRPSFHWSPTMPLSWLLYVCWSAPNTKASRHPILLIWFKEEKKALLPTALGNSRTGIPRAPWGRLVLQRSLLFSARGSTATASMHRYIFQGPSLPQFSLHSRRSTRACLTDTISGNEPT